MIQVARQPIQIHSFAHRQLIIPKPKEILAGKALHVKQHIRVFMPGLGYGVYERTIIFQTITYRLIVIIFG